MPTSQGEVRCDEDGAVWTITIDNQRKRNAFSGSMVYQLEEHLNRADRSNSVRAVIVTGAGTAAFSSGHDLSEMLEDFDHAFDQSANAGFLRPASMRVPVIAAVNGHAYAAGFILAMSCDLRVANETATFATPGAKVGLLPIGGQLSRLYYLMPQARLLELLYTGDPMTAAEANACGFVSKVVPHAALLPAAKDLAHRIARNSPAVITEIKRGVLTAQRDGMRAGELFEWSLAQILKSSPDMQEGISAFLEKRQPRFNDRS